MEKHYSSAEAQTWRRSEVGEVRRKKMQLPEKAGKSRNTLVFPLGVESRLAKAAGAETSGQMRNEKVHVLWCEARLEVKMYKTPQIRSTFGRCDVTKKSALVAQHIWK